MQVTYTHLDGTTQVYTANTAITHNKLLGNYKPGWSTIDQKLDLEAIASSSTTENGITYYYLAETNYVTDFGLSAWAVERLTPEESTVYFQNSENWGESASTNPDFMHWWNKFATDPHVTVSNT